ncbi:Yth domain protein, putative [Medicago truncatula]|uniref:Yth domain protein, putative n=1 Tax=Medicago truncatula TaxID=3880 RepID=A0A072V6Y1_MEDTR|nr:Yth domain protein, putative [Medicago truncatula]
METYDVSQARNQNAYWVEGADINSQFTSPNFEQSGVMYYPAATNYGYYCTGFESPGEWEDQCRIFGVDGPDVQF